MSKKDAEFKKSVNRRLVIADLILEIDDPGEISTSIDLVIQDLALSKSIVGPGNEDQRAENFYTLFSLRNALSRAAAINDQVKGGDNG
jgi:hypothetical protein